MTSETRGERNNNSGNISYVPSFSYQGQLGIEVVPPGETYRPRFARFDTPQNGVRALCVLLKVYYQRHGCDTVTKVISRWAPGNENNTGAYVATVSKEMGVRPDEIILLSQHPVMVRLAAAIIRQENGRVPYPPSMIEEAAEEALGAPTVAAGEPPTAPPPAPRVIVPPVIPVAPRAAAGSVWRKIVKMLGWAE